MSLTPGEAADSLKQIERTGRRSAQASAYANASPGFILWGIIWMVGYAGSDLIHRWSGSVVGINGLWLALTAIGVIGSSWLGRRQQQRAGTASRDRTIGLRWGASFLTFGLFLAATFAVLRPVTPVATGAFVPLVIATIYALFGIWKGQRFLWIGIIVAALTLGGYFWLRDYFLFWMAVVGGGSLVLVGLWLRKI